MAASCEERTLDAQQQGAQDASAPSDVELDKLGLPVESAPGFTQEEAQRWRDEMLPHVEAVTKRTFTHKPKVVLASRQQMEQGIQADAEASLRRQGLDPAEHEAAMSIGLMDQVLRIPMLFGQYVHTRDEIQLPAGQITSLMQLYEIPGASRDDLMRLVIGHELAHALHAQQVGEDGWPLPQTADQRAAVDATIEGFAMLVQQLVAERSGLEELNARLVASPGQLRSAKSQGIDAFADFYEKTYAAGLAFFQHHMKDGGIERVWAILDAPPATYLQITYPERYGELVAYTLDPKRLFEGIQDVLETSGWRSREMSADAESAVSNFAQLGDDQAQAAQALFTKAHSQVFSGPAQSRMVACYEAINADAAEKLEQMLVELAKSQLQIMSRRGAATGGKYTEQREAFDIGDASGTLVVGELTGEEFGQPVRMKLLAAAIASGSHVIQLVLVGESVEEDIARDVARFLVNRLTFGDALVPGAGVDDADPLVKRLQQIRPWLGAGGWSEKLQPLDKQAVGRLAPQSVPVSIAVELGFQAGYAMTLEAMDDPRQTRRLLAVTLARFSGPDSANAFYKGVSEKPTAVLSTALGNAAELSNLQTHTPQLQASCTYTTAMLAAGGESRPVSVGTAQQENLVLHWFTMGESLTATQVEELIDMVLGGPGE